jgi:hypothetical protein
MPATTTNTINNDAHFVDGNYCVRSILLLPQFGLRLRAQENKFLILPFGASFSCGKSNGVVAAHVNCHCLQRKENRTMKHFPIIFLALMLQLYFCGCATTQNQNAANLSFAVWSQDQVSSQLVAISGGTFSQSWCNKGSNCYTLVATIGTRKVRATFFTHDTAIIQLSQSSDLTWSIKPLSEGQFTIAVTAAPFSTKITGQVFAKGEQFVITLAGE